jgi:hypothetical protein
MLGAGPHGVLITSNRYIAVLSALDAAMPQTAPLQLRNLGYADKKLFSHSLDPLRTVRRPDSLPDS